MEEHDVPNSSQVSNDTADEVAKFFGIVILVVGLSIAYWVWPTGTVELPLASLTIGTVLRMLASAAFAVASLFASVHLWI